MSSSTVGRLDWARRTGGLLNRRERARLAAQAIAAQLKLVPARLRYRIGVGEDLVTAAPEDLEGPDSAICRQAEELLQDLRPPQIVGHSYRTFCWARILARRDQVEHDAEILYVAALLHDLGLAAPNGGKARCFTLVGAERAVQLASEAGWSAPSQLAVGEAITLHMNASVAADEGPEAHLLTAGAQLDVTGARYWELSSVAREVVLTRYPRNSAKEALARFFREEARSNPNTRAAVYDRLTGGRHPLRAPFEQ
jgi:HD domain-containing protein